MGTPKRGETRESCKIKDGGRSVGGKKLGQKNKGGFQRGYFWWVWGGLGKIANGRKDDEIAFTGGGMGKTVDFPFAKMGGSVSIARQQDKLQKWFVKKGQEGSNKRGITRVVPKKHS